MTDVHSDNNSSVSYIVLRTVCQSTFDNHLINCKTFIIGHATVVFL